MGGDTHLWGQVDDRESLATIHEALNQGINLIDTAAIYGLGHSEEIVGQAIRGHRDEVVLATKCGLLPPGQPGGLPTRCLTPEDIHKQCDESLRRLKTDVIDLYQCHWPDPEVPISETVGAMTRLLELGKIRAIGLSNYGCEQLAAALEFGPIHTLQPPLSLLHQRAAHDLVPFCQEHGLGVLAYAPLAKGLLTGKFDEEDTFEDLRAKDPMFMGARFKRNLRFVQSLRQIADDHGRTVTELAINWVAELPGVTTTIVGAKLPSQIHENIGGVGWSLSAEDRQRIDVLREEAGVEA